MQQMESLEQLLPNFEQFLDDLSSIKLTSDLEKRVTTYRQRIKLHIEKNSQKSQNAPPRLPDSHPPPLKRPNETDTAYLSRQRVIARETYSSSGGSAPQEDEENIYEDEDFYLEPAVHSPPVPTTVRPTSRAPGLPAVPLENGGTSYGDDIYDEASSTPIQRVIDEEEEQLLYQDVDDDNYDEEFNSDSTDFEEVGEGGQVTSQLQPKQKKGKFELFQEQFADDPQVDMIGELFYSDTSGTLSTRILNKWVRKYCVARDMHLICHNGPGKEASLDLPLPGYRVELRARSGGKKNVLVVSHSSKGDRMFSCRSKEEAERWLEVLQDYATMGHEIEPNSGFVEAAKEDKKTKEKNKKDKKKDKKKTKILSTPQLSTDINGVLSGYVNLYGVYYGDPKWKKNWISIKEHNFSCHVDPNGIIIFQFDLRKTSIDLAEEKRENAALKIFSGEDTYCLVEALSVMDNGQLLKSLVAGISAGNKRDQKDTTLISKMMAAFEKPKGEDSEPSFYEEDRLLPEQQAILLFLSPPVSSGETLSMQTGVCQGTVGLSRDPPPGAVKDPAKICSSTLPVSFKKRGIKSRKSLKSVVYFQHRGSSLEHESEQEESVYTNSEVIEDPAKACSSTLPISPMDGGIRSRKGLKSIVYFQHRGSSLEQENEQEESVHTNSEAIEDRRPDSLDGLYLEIISNYSRSSIKSNSESAPQNYGDIPEAEYVDVVPPSFVESSRRSRSFPKLTKLGQRPDSLEGLYLEIISDYCQTSIKSNSESASPKALQPNGGNSPEAEYVDVVPPEFVESSRRPPGFPKLTKLNFQRTPQRPVSLDTKQTDEGKNENPSSPAKSADKVTKKSAFSRLFSPKGGNAPSGDGRSRDKSPSPSSPKTPPSQDKTAPDFEAKKKAEPEAQTKPSGGGRKLERKLSKVAPGQPDLLLASELSEERAEKELKRKELNQIKKDLRLKKFSLKTDEERERNDEELRAAQREWSEINNELVQLDKKIFLAKNGNLEDLAAGKPTNSYMTGTRRGEPTKTQVALTRRTSYMSGKTAVEDGIIQESEKVTTGTVANMKSLFQGN